MFDTFFNGMFGTGEEDAHPAKGEADDQTGEVTDERHQEVLDVDDELHTVPDVDDGDQDADEAPVFSEYQEVPRGEEDEESNNYRGYFEDVEVADSVAGDEDDDDDNVGYADEDDDQGDVGPDDDDDDEDDANDDNDEADTQREEENEVTEEILNDEDGGEREEADDSQQAEDEDDENDEAERQQYHAAPITNDYDYVIRDELDEAHRILEKAPDKAQKAFTTILEKYPKSPRALYGKAMTLDRMSELHQSNAVLEQSIYLYRDVLDLPDVPEMLYILSGFRCVDRMRFRGFHNKAIRVLQRMKLRLKNSVDVLNQMAVTYLILGQGKNAKDSLLEAMKINPKNGFAKAHYGFILKTDDHLYEEAVKYLQEGINTGEPGTVDGRFYFHLGDALTRLERKDEALKVYEDGVKRGLFMSVYQRSLYNEKNLTSRPWWTPEQTTYGHYLRLLEENWKIIRDEAVPLLSDEDQGFFNENEGLKKKGEWKQFEVYARGNRVDVNCMRTPQTCRLLETIPDAIGNTRGQIKFSVLQPGTRVWPHTGPTNCRIRAHLGLVVPDGAQIRVANETRKWEEGRFIIFDDSFEHEVWHEGSTYRLVLIVDFWHPDLTMRQKHTLSPI